MYLLDIVMPHLTGIETAKRIRARGETAEIMFLTTSREYALDAFSVKASDYLLKPLKNPILTMRFYPVSGISRQRKTLR